MASGFRIAEAYVEVHSEAAGLRSEVDRAVREAGVGQDIKVGLKVDKGSLGGLMANLAPFILPTVAAVGQLTGVLGLVPAAASAAGLAYGTLKVGLDGVGEAFKGNAKLGDLASQVTEGNARALTGQAGAAKAADTAQKAYNKELVAYQATLTGLAPSARDVVMQTLALGPAWSSVKLDVQQRLFAGLGAEVRKVGAADLPVLRGGLVAMAGSLNLAAKYTGDWLASARTTSDVKTIFDNSSVAGQNLARAIQPILGLIRDLAVVGSSFLPKLSSGFADSAQKAADFIGHARETGKIHEWIQTGINAFGSLWQVVKNIVGIFMQIANAPGFSPNIISGLAVVTGWVLELVKDFPELIPLIEGALVAWRAYTVVQWAVNAAMTANPIGLVIVAIGALVAAIVLVITHWDQFKGTMAAIFNWMGNEWIREWDGFRDYWVGVWNDIKNRAWSIWDETGGALIRKFTDLRNGAANIWHGWVNDFNSIWGSVEGIAGRVWDNVTGAFRNGVNNVIGLINRLVDGADAVLGFLHIALIPHIPGLAAGGVVGLAGGGTVGRGFTTNGPMAIVGEGNPNHPEYVIPTDPAHRDNALALYQSLGAKLMAGGGILDWIGSTVSKVEKWTGDGALGLMNQAVDGLAGAIPGGMFRDVAAGVGHNMVAAIKAMIDKAQQAFSAAFTGSPNLAGWIQTALGLTGTPGTWAGPLSVLIGRESGGNPNAINLWDSNAAAGHPSQGLMQTIPGTFSAYHQSGTSWNILDPVANIAAGINYIKARYGSIFNVQQANPNASPRGYDSGGLLPTGLTLVRNSTGAPERVLTATQTAKLDRILDSRGGLGGVTVNITQVSGSPAETGRFVALALRTVG